MEESTDKGLDFLDGSPADEELQAVKDVITMFFIAIKNYALYPEDNTICQNSVAKVKTCLDGFLKNHGDLRLDVEEDRLVFRGEVVHHGPPKEGNIAFILFRDGIQWLEFQKEIELREITGLFKILNRYRTTHEEAEGDLVTALWEKNFPHLRYEATDIFWETEPVADLSLLSATNKGHCDVDQPEEEQEDAASTNIPTMDHALWELTPDEIKNIQEMVLEEEKQDNTEDVLNVLTVILGEQSKRENFSAILEFMEEEFQAILAQGEFKLAFKLLKNLHEIHQSCKTDKQWTIPLLNHFFLAISSPRSLAVLHQVWPAPDDNMASDRAKVLRQVLILLPPDVILTLGPMLLRIDSSRIRRQLMEIIEFLANKDLRPLEQLLYHPEEVLVRKLVHILGHLKGNKPSQILLKMIRHSSEQVRKEALAALVVRDPTLLKKYFFVIDDTSDAIRRLMLEHLGRRRSTLAEALLLDYLEQQQFKLRDHQHILGCYVAIGQCGSFRSVPFLRKVLLRWGWIPGFGRSVHRQGAVVALIGLGTEEAQEILEKASQSLFPSVRRAYRKAVEDNKQHAEARH